MDPIPDALIADVVRAYGRLSASHRDAFAGRPMVLPNGACFPDPYTGDEASLARLVQRMQRHAGLEALGIEPKITESPACSCGGGCGGGCEGCTCDHEHPKITRLVRTADGWQLNVLDAELDSPELLAVQIARMLGAALVLGRDADSVPAGAGDLAAVGLGFGALLMEGSYVYRKTCHGPSVGKLTELGCAELAIAFALFVSAGGHPARRARGVLGATQRALFGQAMAWAKSNPQIVARLQKSPERIAAGDFQLMEPLPWLSRLIGRRRYAKEESLEQLEAELASAPAAARPAKQRDPKLEEIRKLVDEALDEAGSGAQP
jgi:hypothetical protein